MVLIYSILGFFVTAGVAGWFYSDRTRKLVKFALVVIAVMAGIVFAIDLVVRTWFPYSPF